MRTPFSTILISQRFRVSLLCADFAREPLQEFMRVKIPGTVGFNAVGLKTGEFVFVPEQEMVVIHGPGDSCSVRDY